MKLGIVGLPNVGKSTLFNALTGTQAAQAQNYPFCTIDPNVGMVTVPDERLDELERIYNAKKKVYAHIEFFDIAGLVKGASQGEGLGNQFLSHIREVEAIVHVVRCFENENVIHVDGSVDPIRDIETINYELILSDLDILQRRIKKTATQLKGDKKLQPFYDLLLKLEAHLQEGNSARTFDCTDDEKDEVRLLNLLSNKPIIYAANISEEDVLEDAESNQHVARLREFANAEGSGLILFCAKMEEELVGLSPEEKSEFLADLGVAETGLNKLIKESYSLLNLMSFLTAGEQEIRAWTIKKNTKAKNAAGKIHSDIERGFIRAEIVKYEQLKEEGSINACKDKGLLRLEGKDYIMQEGDVVNFRFNV